MKDNKDAKRVDGISMSIATRLKQVRSEHNLSLDKAAALTGVSKAMLGQIERQESSPTIATLWKIATGLKVSFSSFLTNNVPSESIIQQGFIHDPNMQVSTLFPYSSDKGFEVFEITLSQFHEQHSSAHQTGVTEHLHVLEGKLGVLEGNQWIQIEVGKQFVLAADQAHGYKDMSGKTRFISIIHYPMVSL